MRVSVLHEAHDVSPDSANDLDEATGLPLLQRELPAQVEEIRVDSARDEVIRTLLVYQGPKGCATANSRLTPK